MLIKIPYRHYQKYNAKIIYINGKMCGQSGSAGSNMLGTLDEDILAIALIIQDNGSNPVARALWLDGEWQEYDEELFNQLRGMNE